MLEGRFGLLIGFRQGDPDLQSMQMLSVSEDLSSAAFGMDDATSCRHPFDLTRRNQLYIPEAVAVHNLTGEQITDGGKTDIRMRPHIDPGARCKIGRTEMIKKNKRPDIAGGVDNV